MTLGHQPPPRHDAGARRTSEETDRDRWLWPLVYGAVAWGLAALLVAGGGDDGPDAFSHRLVTLLPLLATVPVAAALGAPAALRRTRAATIAGHGVVVLLLSGVLFLVSPTGARGAFPAAAADVVIGLAGYGLILGAAALAHSRLDRRDARIALAHARDVALRAQLNPHFLFNTLHSLASMVRHDPDTAGEAIAVLGDLLRYVLDADATGDVPLQRELQFVEGYLRLEHLRLGDRLGIDVEIDPETLGLPIPSLCLQPLVENAVRHGISPRPAGGRVAVTVQLLNELLVLRVTDTGIGMEPAAVDAAPGLGLRAIRRRIEHRFGESARLELASAPGHGVTAELRLPVHPLGPRSRHSYGRGDAHRR